MSRAKWISDEQRDAILGDLEIHYQYRVSEICKRHGISSDSLSRIRRDAIKARAFNKQRPADEVPRQERRNGVSTECPARAWTDPIRPSVKDACK